MVQRPIFDLWQTPDPPITLPFSAAIAPKILTSLQPFRRRQWHPTPVLLPGKSHGQKGLVGCSPWGREESDMTERLHFHFYALEKEMATHSSVLAWRIPGMGLHSVRHDWSDLAVAVTTSVATKLLIFFWFSKRILQSTYIYYHHLFWNTRCREGGEGHI